MPDLLDRLTSKFTIGDGCWQWHAANSDGYGQIRVARKMHQAHRVLYELLIGPVPTGLELDHLCRNRGCVRPSHLEPVTHVENIRRGDTGAWGSLRTHCAHGHPFDAANTYVQAGRRVCRECGRIRSKRYYNK